MCDKNTHTNKGPKKHAQMRNFFVLKGNCAQTANGTKTKKYGKHTHTYTHTLQNQ